MSLFSKELRNQAGEFDQLASGGEVTFSSACDMCRQAADLIDQLEGHLRQQRQWIGWSSDGIAAAKAELTKAQAEVEALRLGQRMLSEEKDEAREAARIIMARRHNSDFAEVTWKEQWPWLIMEARGITNKGE